MQVLRRSGSSTTPMVVDGRVITLRARTLTLPIGSRVGGLTYVRVRPDHVEILERDGRHVTIPVHDIEYAARVGLALATAAIIVTARIRRRRGART
jgi:hypothetical protein